jgi:hypothetical protein
MLAKYFMDEEYLMAIRCRKYKVDVALESVNFTGSFNRMIDAAVWINSYFSFSSGKKTSLLQVVKVPSDFLRI